MGWGGGKEVREGRKKGRGRMMMKGDDDGVEVDEFVFVYVTTTSTRNPQLTTSEDIIIDIIKGNLDP